MVLSAQIHQMKAKSENLLEADLVDAIVALPDKLFYSTGIPVSLWILNRNKENNPNYRNRKHEVLFIDARNLGQMIDRRHRELSSEGENNDVSKIANVLPPVEKQRRSYEDVKDSANQPK